MRVASASSLTALAIALATPAVAQDAAPANTGEAAIGTAQDGVVAAPAVDTISDDDIVVIAGSLRGQVDAPQPAIV